MGCVIARRPAFHGRRADVKILLGYARDAAPDPLSIEAALLGIERRLDVAIELLYRLRRGAQ